MKQVFEQLPPIHTDVMARQQFHACRRRKPSSRPHARRDRGPTERPARWSSGGPALAARPGPQAGQRVAEIALRRGLVVPREQSRDQEVNFFVKADSRGQQVVEEPDGSPGLGQTTAAFLRRTAKSPRAPILQALQGVNEPVSDSCFLFGLGCSRLTLSVPGGPRRPGRWPARANRFRFDLTTQRLRTGFDGPYGIRKRTASRRCAERPSNAPGALSRLVVFRLLKLQSRQVLVSNTYWSRLQYWDSARRTTPASTADSRPRVDGGPSAPYIPRFHLSAKSRAWRTCTSAVGF